MSKRSLLKIDQDYKILLICHWSDTIFDITALYWPQFSLPSVMDTKADDEAAAARRRSRTLLAAPSRTSPVCMSAGLPGLLS